MTRASPGAILARILAEVEARAAAFPAIEPVHVWMAVTKLAEIPPGGVPETAIGGEENRPVLTEEHARLVAWFSGNGIDTRRSRRRLRAEVGRGPGSPAELHRSGATLHVFDRAASLAEAEGRRPLGAVDLAEYLLRHPPPPLAMVLRDAGAVPPAAAPDPAKREPVDGDEGFLARYGRDLTALARAGKLGPVIGRRNEMRRVARILSQKRKRNALLVGDAGVGKTCVVEGLAQVLATRDAPGALADRRLVEITMSSLLAGTKYRGELEERVQGLLAEAASDARLILFLDEMHTVMGHQGGGVDVADMLKPALARGDLQVVGATTTPEYERTIARDEAFERRFEVVWIEEPSRDEAREIVLGVKPSLEAHHRVRVSDEAVEAALDLSIRYLPDRRLPDKALDLIDEAGARAVLATLSNLPLIGGDDSHRPTTTLSRTEIAQVVAERCRVPLRLLAIDVRERLGDLEPWLRERLVGQDAAIGRVTDALVRSYRGLREARRPVASFLFAGPSGVGKTEMARALAEFLFGGLEALVRIDLSEYTEKHQLARLIGAPPGYVGYEEPGKLTTALRQRPASVVLFDEIEKGHPDVLNLLLQILDEGQLTDGHGRRATFREAVVVLTTNLVLDADGGHRKLGFAVEAPGDRAAGGPDDLRRALLVHLHPELVGRIGEVVGFRPLDRDALLVIARRHLERLGARARLDARVLEVLRAEIESAVAEGPFGARDVERRVEELVARGGSAGA